MTASVILFECCPAAQSQRVGEGGLALITLNTAVVLAEKFCYWVEESYPTHSDQIFLYIAETHIRRSLVVRNVF